VGSNPTAALVLVALLAAFRFAGEQIKEAIMSKKLRNLKSKVRVVKRCVPKSASIITHVVETIWAMGAGVAAAMVISTSAHRAGRQGAPPHLAAASVLGT
jgi:hypothetical protein